MEGQCCQADRPRVCCQAPPLPSTRTFGRLGYPDIIAPISVLACCWQRFKPKSCWSRQGCHTSFRQLARPLLSRISYTRKMFHTCSFIQEFLLDYSKRPWISAYLQLHPQKANFFLAPLQTRLILLLFVNVNIQNLKICQNVKHVWIH